MLRYLKQWGIFSVLTACVRDQVLTNWSPQAAFLNVPFFCVFDVLTICSRGQILTKWSPRKAFLNNECVAVLSICVKHQVLTNWSPAAAFFNEKWCIAVPVPPNSPLPILADCVTFKWDQTSWHRKTIPKKKARKIRAKNNPKKWRQCRCVYLLVFCL